MFLRFKIEGQESNLFVDKSPQVYSFDVREEPVKEA